MARPRRVAQVEPAFDPISDVIEQQAEVTAEQLGSMLDDLGSIVAPNSEIKVYKATERGGKWAFVKALHPPIQTDGLLEDLREDWGGGEYYFRVYADGKAAATRRAIIAGDIRPKHERTGGVQADSTREMLPLIMSTQQKSSGDMMAMMMAMMQQQSAASDRQMQMMMTNSQNQMQMLTALLPVIAGGKMDPLQLIAAMQSNKGGGMEETIKMLALAKEMFGNSGEGGSDDMFTAAIKAFGPGMATAIGNMANNPNAPVLPAPRITQQMPPGYRPMPAGAPQYRPAVMPPPMPGLDHPTPEASGDKTPSNPVLALISRDVLFFANGDYDAALAAEAVLAKIEKAGIPENDLMALVLRFQSSEDWIADVAGEGLDLRHKREWAQEFISELVAQYTQGDQEDDHTAGRGGGEGDTI